MSIREDLKAYLDDELSPARKQEVRESLDRDPKLAAEARALQSIATAIRSSEAKPVPAGRELAIARAAKGPRIWRPGRSLRLSPLATVLASVLVVAVLGALFFPVMAQSKDAAKRVALTIPFAFNSSDESNSDEHMPATAGGTAGTAGTDGETGTYGIAGGVSGSASAKSRVDHAPPVRSGIQPNGQSTTPVDEQPEAAAEAKGIPTPSAGQYQGSAYPPGTDQPYVIRTGDISVQVADVQASSRQASQVATRYGGFVADSSSETDTDGQATAQITLRVPEQRFDNAFQDLAALGKVEKQDMSGQDVTSQIVDTDARIKTMKAEQDEYRTLLSHARSVGQVLAIKDRLDDVQQSLDSLEAQRKELSSQATFSTITCELDQKPKLQAIDQPNEGWAEDAWVTAANGLEATLRFLASVAIYLFVFAPVWLPVALITWWINRRRA